MKLIIKACFLILLFLTLVVRFSNAQEKEFGGKALAEDAAGGVLNLDKHFADRTTHPDAQWFPEASLGLFMHWGIHSVKGLQPSWAMIKDYEWAHTDKYNSPEAYYELEKEFNPDKYDPEIWVKAAKKAGFNYVVLTVKHHDGFTLWPSENAKYSTRNYMNGRDLLKPYVEACRRYGLKVGFYFSQRDWSYPAYEKHMTLWNFDAKNRNIPRPPIDSTQSKSDFEEFYVYTKTQLEELLTNYGKIDLLWFDGLPWQSIDDIKSEETIKWVRSIQPHIVINDRWKNLKGEYLTGDFKTLEYHGLDKEIPYKWWEYCRSWKGHWGYSPGRKYMPLADVMQTLLTCRAKGGNFLLNLGPGPDSTMPDGFYERLDSLSHWMSHSKESLIGANPVRSDITANVPLTRKGSQIYAHVLPEFNDSVEIRTQKKPLNIRLLKTQAKINYKYHEHVVKFVIPQINRTKLNDVVVMDLE